jgi:hypothetical protein
MIGFGFENSHGFLPVPVTFDLMPVFIVPAAAVAMAEFFRIIILKRLLLHGNTPSSL